MFITFEGPDGCGKTTQIALLSEFLENQGYTVLRTREPGGTRIGEMIRDVLHNPQNKDMVFRTEILLYSASRAQLVEQVIRPALAEGKVVLCDRFFDSTLAYQGYGRGLDLDDLTRITRFAVGGLCPDMTVYIDIEPDEGLRRRQADSEAEWNRLDALELAFHERVHHGYLALIEKEPSRWIKIDGDQSVDAVQMDVRNAVTARIDSSES